MRHDPKLVKKYLISAAQMRAARGLLGWSQTRLATEAGMSLPTVKRYETAATEKVSDGAIEKLQAALEASGIEFIDGDAPGVQIRRKAEKRIQGAKK
jgi:transcriptional regulator with XRE-family HTH domain